MTADLDDILLSSVSPNGSERYIKARLNSFRQHLPKHAFNTVVEPNVGGV